MEKYDEDIRLFEQARRRVQRKIKGRCVTNKDVIIDQEREIEYYRNKIGILEEKIHNKKTFERKFEIDIDLEKYLIMYNTNTDQVVLYTYLIKLINEDDKYMIAKDNEFKIINETRFKNKRFVEW